MGEYALFRSLGALTARPGRAVAEFEDAFPEVEPRKNSRKRVFDDRTTIGLALRQALNRNAPCKDSVRQMQIESGAKISSSSAAYCKARARMDAAAVKAMSDKLSDMADHQCADTPFARINALDGTSFQADDTDANRARWPYASGQKPGCGFPVVGCMMSHSLVGGGSEVLATAPWSAHDFRLFVEASKTFREGDLEIGDRAFCSFTAFAILGEAKADGIFRGKEWCLKTRPDDVWLGKGDRLTVWSKRQSKRSSTVPKERLDGFPDELQLRIITAKIRVRGFRDETIVIVTSLLDAEAFPKEYILSLYMRRWEIEVSFRDMKTTLRYEFIRGKSPKTVLIEISILLLAYNLMRYMMARATPGCTKPRHGIASTSAALKACLAILSCASGVRAFNRIVKRMLAAVRSDKLPKRLRPMQVRAVKRRPKPYRMLMKPRSEYRPEERI